MNRILISAFLCALSFADAAESPVPVAAGDNYSYFEGASDFDTSERTPSTEYLLLELKTLPSAGYTSVRAFAYLSELPQDDQADRNARISIRISHTLQGRSIPYKTETSLLSYGLGRSLLLEAPIIGTSISISVFGTSLPRGKTKLAMSAYLTK